MQSTNLSVQFERGVHFLHSTSFTLPNVKVPISASIYKKVLFGEAEYLLDLQSNDCEAMKVQTRFLPDARMFDRIFEPEFDFWSTFCLVNTEADPIWRLMLDDDDFEDGYEFAFEFNFEQEQVKLKRAIAHLCKYPKRIYEPIELFLDDLVVEQETKALEMRNIRELTTAKFPWSIY